LSIEIEIQIPDSELKQWSQYPDMVDIKFELIRGFMRQKYIRDYNLEINVNNG